MDKILTKSSLEDIIDILELMFSEKIEFYGKKHRTDSYNNVLDVIFRDTSQLRTKNGEEADKNSASSPLVPGAGIEPALHC